MTPGTQRRVIIYTRVSRDPRKQRESTTQQEYELRDTGDEENWDIVTTFSDPDRSASEFARKERPGFLDMEAYLRGAHDIDCVAIWEASRLARSLSVGVRFRDMCQKAGVLIWYSGSYFDMKNADQRKAFTDALVDAEHESAKTSKRVQRSVRSRAREGRPHGKQLFGYIRRYETGPSGKPELLDVVEEPDQAGLLRQMANRVLAGESCYGIARDLTTRAVPAPHGNVWHATNVTRLLKNPAYVGKRVLHGEIVSDGIWPAIFDEVTWARLQSLLNDPARKTRRDGAVQHLLTGIATCGVCGGQMRLAKNRGVPSYICHGLPRTPQNPKPRRFCTARKQTDVDSAVQVYVVDVLSRPDALRELRPTEDQEQTVAVLDERISAVQARLDGFYDSAAKGEISPAGLARIEPQLISEREALEAERSRVTRPTVLRSLDLSNAGEDWFTWPLTKQRTVLRDLFVVTIKPVGVGRRVFDPSTVVVQLRGLSA